MTRCLYRSTVPSFIDLTRSPDLVSFLAAEASTFHQDPTPGELRSWRRSLPALAHALDVPEFRHDEIFVELLMPTSSSRCDALLTGRRRDGQPTAVVVELKQWTDVKLHVYPEHVLAHGQLKLHPSEQVRGYVEHLKMYNAAFHEGTAPVLLYGTVYLHDMQEGASLALLGDRRCFSDLPRRFPVFGRHQVDALRAFLAERLVPGPGADIAERISTARVAPSPRLLDHVVATIEGRFEWRLLDEQKTAYWAISAATTAARVSDERHVIIVKGGPGTGKSVIALQLLAHGARQGWRVVHATGSKAFQTVLRARMINGSREILKRLHRKKFVRELPVKELFTTFAEAAKIAGRVEKGELDGPVELIVADEAHRLWEYRRIKYPNGQVKWLTDVPMVEEFLLSTRVSAFFLDDNQSVRPGEIGRASVIEAHAARLGIPVQVIDLARQFRCGGCIEYTDWVDGLLDFAPSSAFPKHSIAYGISVATDMAAAVASLRERHLQGERCRVVAGFCWKWSKPLPHSSHQSPALVHDIQDARFGGWSAPWIEKTGKDLAPLLNQYTRWASDAQDTRGVMFEQVGSIYSAQGFEFDHVLVIWGEDLVRRGDKWTAQLNHNKDSALKKEIRSASSDSGEQERAAAAKLRNVYRVLLTRGMVSTTLVILDEETRAWVRDRLPATIGYRLEVG